MKYIFTDGSSSNNGYSNCKSGAGVYFHDNVYDNISNAVTEQPSNQRAELVAILLAMQSTVKDKETYTIVTDSKYSIDCITVWSKNWKKNNWKTTKREPVKHKDIISSILDLVEVKPFLFLHVNSHMSRPKEGGLEYTLWYGNDQADKLAKAGLDRNNLK